MNRPAKSTVRHGMASCARYGCQEEQCRAAAHRARKQHRQDMKLGIRQSVDAGPARAHAELLVHAGMSPADIAARSGLGISTIHLIRRASTRNVWRSSADAVLGIPVPEKTAVSRPRTMVPAVGTVRRMQALSARGFGLPTLAAGLGLAVPNTAQIRSGHRVMVCIQTHVAAVALYERLWRADPVGHGIAADRAATTRTYARRHGWAPPGCWDEDRIDDPAAFPDWTGHCGTASGRLLHVAAGEEPCGTCAPHMPFVGPVKWGVSQALAKAVPDALLALADAGRTHVEVAVLLGVSGDQVGYAHRLIQQSRMETAA
jgi:hypothetical protein